MQRWLGGRSVAGGRVQVFGCSPGCLIASLLLSVLLTIALNLILRGF
jgi:ribose/xylose/arabinose/galactoside ABC-type transport system permease subunit